MAKKSTVVKKSAVGKKSATGKKNTTGKKKSVAKKSAADKKSVVEKKRPAWSADEDDTLLRAWAYVVADASLNRTVIKSLIARFQKLQGGTTQRSDFAVERRRQVLLHMHDIIRKFYERSDDEQQQVAYSSADFYELTHKEQRHWIRTIDPSSHGTASVPRDTYERVSAIVASENSSSSSSSSKDTQQFLKSKRVVKLPSPALEPASIPKAAKAAAAPRRSRTPTPPPAVNAIGASKRVLWTADEEDAFFDAWAFVEADALLKKTVNKSLSARLRDVLGATSQRSYLSVENRRRALLRMHDIVCQFHAQTDQSQYGAYSSTDFFELTYGEQRRWIETLDPMSHGTINITRETFARIHAIVAPTAIQASSSSITARAPSERKRFADLLPLPDRANKRTRVTEPSNIVIAAYDSAASDSSSSSSESDDDGDVHTTRLAKDDASDDDDDNGGSGDGDSDDDSEYDSDKGDCGESDGKSLSLLVTRTHSHVQKKQMLAPRLDHVTSTTATKASGDSSSSLSHTTQTTVAVNNGDDSKSIAVVTSRQSVESVVSDTASLVRRVSDQTQWLQTMLAQVQREREYEDRARRRAAHKMHQSFAQVRDDVRRCERMLERQSSACDRERAAIKRELVQLQQDKQQQDKQQQCVDS